MNYQNDKIRRHVGDTLESGPEPEDRYRDEDDIVTTMTREDVLEKVAPIVREENLRLRDEQTSVSTFGASPRVDDETGEVLWLVTLLYDQIDGQRLNASQMYEYGWITVDDRTGRIGEKILARP